MDRLTVVLLVVLLWVAEGRRDHTKLKSNRKTKLAGTSAFLTNFVVVHYYDVNASLGKLNIIIFV